MPSPLPAKPNHIPDGYPAVIPYLIVKDAPRLLTFLKEAFGGEEIIVANREDDGTIQHAAVRVAGSVIELSEGGGNWPARPGAIHLYVEDTDAVYARALRAGATSLFEIRDMDYGERSGGVQDPTGNHWYIATHLR